MDWQNVVTNLLVKAQDGATTKEERDSLTAKATYLMAKYGVEALLDRPKDVPLNVEVVVLNIPNPYSKLRGVLIHRVAHALGLRSVRNPRTKQMHVFGLPTDLKNFANLYASLWIQALLGLAGAEKPEWVHGKTFNHSYMLGFVDEVTARVQAAANRANQDSASTAPSTALVLKDRANAIDQEVEKAFPSLRRGTHSMAKSTIGYQFGADAGRRADINQPRMGGSYTSQRSLT